MVAEVKKAFLVLAQPIVVLIGRRVENRRNAVSGIGLLPALRTVNGAAGGLGIINQFRIVKSGLPDAVDIEIV